MNPDDRHDLGSDDPIDALLRRAYAPPADVDLARVARAAIAAPSRRRMLARWLAAAATLLLALGGWQLLRRPVGPEGHDGAQLGAMWAAAYEHALANREAPDGKPFCCDPSVDFCGTCEKRFDVRLGFGATGANITLRGCYCGLSTGGCIAALVDTAAGPVGVFVVPRGKDPRPQLPAQSPWRLVRRDLGALTLYAVGGMAADPAIPLAQFRIEP